MSREGNQRSVHGPGRRWDPPLTTSAPAVSEVFTPSPSAGSVGSRAGSRQNAGSDGKTEGSRHGEDSVGGPVELAPKPEVPPSWRLASKSAGDSQDPRLADCPSEVFGQAEVSQTSRGW